LRWKDSSFRLSSERSRKQEKPKAARIIMLLHQFNVGIYNLEDVQNQTIILDDYSTTLCGGVSILPPDREHTSLLGPRKLDFSSREISL
jgi:hypothetical protein